MKLLMPGSAVILLLFMAMPAEAQRLLDWPLRTTAGPESTMRGVEATFWNPAGIATGATRGQVIIADQRAPSAIGLGGFAAGAAWRLDGRTTLGAGYQHVSVDDIGGTSTSPLPDSNEPAFSVGEDQIALGISHQLGTSVVAGGAVRHDRSNESGVNESATSLGAGFLLTPALPLRPVLGVNVLTQSGGVRFSGGLELTSALGTDVQLKAGYGVRGGRNAVATEHRIGLTVDWRAMVALTGGVATSDAGSERSYEPVLGASLRVSRYELGVLREGLANDFGGAYSFRFKVGLK